MFQISVKTYEGKEVIKRVIDKELAIFYFKAFTAAEDAKEVIMIDGLTGEVLYLYTIGEGWSVFNGIGLEL